MIEVIDRANGQLIEVLTVEEAAERIRGWDFAAVGYHERELLRGREFASVGCLYRLQTVQGLTPAPRVE